MALSNIFNEPRREITETVVGALTVGIPSAAFLFLDYQLVAWTLPPDHPMPFPAAMAIVGLLLAALVLIGAILSTLVHAAGEGVCDALERRGIQLRPRERYAARSR